MAAKRKANPTPGMARAYQSLPIADRLSWLVVSLTTFALPLVVSLTGKDPFRLPKQLFLEASSIILATIAICATILGAPLAVHRQPRSLRLVIVAALLWPSVTALTSTNRMLSVFSLVTVASATMLFVAAYNAASHRSIAVLYVALAPALINAVIAVAQWTNMWDPLQTAAARPPHLRAVALLGNPNDVGMFLVAPTLAAFAFAVASETHRLGAGIVGAVLASGVMASETLGALAALSTGLFVLFFRQRPRLAVTGAFLTILLLGASLSLSPTRWSAARSKFSAAARGDLDPLLSGRLAPFFAAWRMFLEHPIVGVGPGCFAFHYFEAKVANEMKHPSLINQRSEVPPNFGEVHNEHLQVLAEGGLPAYGIFIAALVVLARPSFRSCDAGTEARTRFAYHLGFPLAVSIFVLSLSSFPLRLAAPTQNTLMFCAMALAWSKDAHS